MKRYLPLILSSLLASAMLYVGLAQAADVKISALPAGTTLAGTEVAPFVQSAATVKITPAQIATYVLSVAPALPAGANPTGTVGLTAVNGSATSFLRSDGAPALSQAISPTWSGTHIFSNAVTGASFIPTSATIPTNGMYLSAANQLNFATNSTGRGFFTSGGEFDITIGEKLSNATIPYLTFNVSGQSANARAWGVQATGAIFSMNAQDDAGGTIRNILAATRSGAGLTDISVGNATDNNTFTFLGTGPATATQWNLSANVTTAGSSRNGLLLLGTNQVGIQANGSSIGALSQAAVTFGSVNNPVFNWASTGQFNVQGLIDARKAISLGAGTKFTTTGCSVSATTGGNSGGTFTLGANSCNVVVTLNGATGVTAPVGWSCTAHDRTAPTVLIGGESSSTTTTATIAIPAGAGATDVISFACLAF